MARKRNWLYRRRKNYRKNFRRREVRRRGVVAPACQVGTPALIYCGRVSGEHALALGLPGTRLNHVRTASDHLQVWLHALRSRPDNEPRWAILAKKHDHPPISLPRRTIMLDQPSRETLIRSLDRVFDFTGLGGPYLGAIGSYHQCPFHFGIHTLRIIPAPLGGDFFFVCSECGSSLTTIEFVRAHTVGEKSFEEVAADLHRLGVIQTPLSAEALTAVKQRTLWRGYLERGRAYHDFEVLREGAAPIFGDWAKFMKCDLASLFTGMKVPARYWRERFLVRASRNAAGAIARLVLCSHGMIPTLQIRFTADRLLFDSPRWADYLDWSRDLIVCPNPQIATAIERAVCKWPKEQRAPVATISEATGVLQTYGKLFRTVWLPVPLRGSAAYGLVLVPHAHDVRVKRLSVHCPEIGEMWPADDLGPLESLTRAELLDPASPSSVEFVAGELARDSRALPATLSTLLATTVVPGPVARDITARAAELQGMAVVDLTEQLDLASNPFAAEIGANLYVCRGDRFLKKTRTGEFLPISNFSARITTLRERRDNPVLEVQLTVEGRYASFSITNAAFDDPRRLWNAVRTAAQSASLPYPLVYPVADRKLLPVIVRMTAGAAPIPKRPVAERQCVIEEVTPIQP